MDGELEWSKKKKLIAAAEYWVSGGVQDDTDSDAAAFGITIEKPVLKDTFSVWPENWPTIIMWSRIQTQWRTGAAGAIGLDYTILPWFIKLYEVEEPKTMLEDLQVMESAALTAMSKEK